MSTSTAGGAKDTKYMFRDSPHTPKDFTFGNTSDLMGYARSGFCDRDKDDPETQHYFVERFTTSLDEQIQKGCASLDTSVMGHKLFPESYVILTQVTTKVQTAEHTTAIRGSLYVGFFYLQDPNARGFIGLDDPYPDNPAQQRKRFKEDFRKAENRRRLLLKRKDLKSVNEEIDSETESIWDRLKATLPSSIQSEMGTSS